VPRLIRCFALLLGIFSTTLTSADPIRDKTLVVWVAPENLTQHGGSALTIESPSSFDGIVFAELAPKKWMAGSEVWLRSQKDQAAWPEETNDGKSFVQIAIVYHGDQVTTYRDGKEYSSFKMSSPPVTYGPAAVVVFGRRHLDAGDKENSFTGRIKDARVYDKPLDREAIATLKPGQAGDLKPWAWWSFGDEGLREKTGRFTEIQLLGDVRLEDGALVLGGKGATVINTALGDGGDNPLAVPKKWSAAGAVPDDVVASARQLRERFLADPYRPTWHFCTPEDQGVPGDPNGAFYANGRYHLMYLYNRAGSGFCWGHISSSDLVHWRNHPDAIGPGGADEGCFSGGAFVDDDGTAWLSYWMLWGAKGIGLASSRGPDFDVWKKSEANPVITSTEFGVTELSQPIGGRKFLGSADPSNIWKHDGKYYMLTGNLLVLNKIGRAEDAPVSEQGDRLYLFESDDLKSWKYRHIFYERKPEWTDRSEDDMCPSFLPLPSSADGGPPSDKHLLLFISHNKGCQYYIGDYKDDHFLPESHGRMTWNDNTYFAPEALIDGNGRQIMWAWLTDNPAGEKERGWSGVYGLPRSLWLGDDGTLRMAPVKELETLRADEKSWPQFRLGDGESKPLEGVRGDSCEIIAEFELGNAKTCGLKVRTSPDGQEETLIYYNAEKKALILDSTKSGGDGRKGVESAPLELKAGEPLRLRVFVDKPVVEVFANDRQAIGRRVYPTRADSLGVSAFATGGSTKVIGVKAWTMSPANPY
jgi:beta-fructofuranosidase